MFLSNLIIFLRKNHKGYSKWTTKELAYLITLCVKNHLCIITSDTYKNITGMVLAEVYPETKTLHVLALVARTKNAIKQIATIRKIKFAEWRIQGYRKSTQLVIYPHNVETRLVYAKGSQSSKC